jgi:Uncharacterised nucleotidyltransferase
LALTDQFDTASYRDEWRALLECTSPAFDAQRFRELARAVDWSGLLFLAEEQGVIGHFAYHLRELDQNFVPADVKRMLLERHRAQVFSTLKITAELFRLLEYFAAKEIPALVVKGPALAMQAYGDPAMRYFGDLDLLVRHRDIRRATEAMIASGFEATVPLSAIDAGRIPGQYLFSKPSANLLVELHNDFTLRYFPRRLAIEGLFDRHIQVQLDGHEAPALAVEDELVYICVHGATHFWDRLGWIADVAALVTRKSDIHWDVAMKIAKVVGAERMLYTGLRLATDLLNAPLPVRVLSIVRSDPGAAKLAQCARAWLIGGRRTFPSLFERAVFRLRMRGSKSAAPAYLLRLSLSPTEEDWQTGGEISHNRLFEALRRPYRLALKHGPWMRHRGS